MKSKEHEILTQQVNELRDLKKIAKKLKLDHVHSSIAFAIENNTDDVTIQEWICDELAGRLRGEILFKIQEEIRKKYKSPNYVPDIDPFIKKYLDENTEEEKAYAAFENKIESSHSELKQFTLAFNSGMSCLVAISNLLIKLKPKDRHILAGVGSSQTLDILNDMKYANPFDIWNGKDTIHLDLYDLFLMEPVKADFHMNPVSYLELMSLICLPSNKKFQMIALDISSCGLSFDSEKILQILSGAKNKIVVFYRSGLKLDQLGLALKNHGILDVFTSKDLFKVKDKLNRFMVKSRGRTGTYLDLESLMVLNEIVTLNQRDYTNRILENTKHFFSQLSVIPEDSCIKSIIYPMVSNHQLLSSHVLIKLKEDNEDDYHLFIEYLIHEMAEYNCHVNLNSGYGFRNIAYELIKNHKLQAEFVLQITPGIFRGFKYHHTIDLINALSKLTLQEMRLKIIRENYSLKNEMSS